MLDWQGRPYDPARGPAAHPNSRFTVAARRNPVWSPHAEDARGVPITALVFGGRRREVAPLVYEARNWQHGVLVGASVASETTAAAVGQVGVVRRDPMAMQPFCGYNFGDYWQHWLEVGAKLTQRAAHLPRQLVPPRRAGQVPVAGLRRESARAGVDAGSLRRQGRGAAKRRSAGCRAPRISNVERPRASDADALAALLSVDPALWRKEVAEIREYLARYGSRLPAALLEELEATEQRLG